MLDLNDVQEGVLNVAFRVADDNGLTLIDMKDLRALLDAIAGRGKKEGKGDDDPLAPIRKAAQVFGNVTGHVAPSSASSWCWRTRARRILRRAGVDC